MATCYLLDSGVLFINTAARCDSIFFWSVTGKARGFLPKTWLKWKYFGADSISRFYN